MFSQIIHRVGECLLLSNLILLIFVSGIVVGNAPPAFVANKGRSSERSRTAPALPPEAPASPAQQHHLPISFPTKTTGPFTNPVRLTQDKRYEVVKTEPKELSSAGTPTLHEVTPFRIFSRFEPSGQYAPHQGKTGAHTAAPAGGSHEDVQDILENFINAAPDLNNNLDVITQAFRFVKLDAHLSALVNQLIKLQESHDELQTVTVKQETKFGILMEQMRLLANSLSSETTKLKEVEDRIGTEVTTMNHKLEAAVEKIIKSSTSSEILMDISKETLQQLDKVDSKSEKVLKELQTIQTELSDVGQVSVQTVFNIQKSEENLMTAMAEMGNRTIYALRQEPFSKVQGLPVLLGNASRGNFMLADVNTISSSDSVSTPSSSASVASSKLTQYSMSCSSRTRLINELPMDCVDIQILGHRRSGVYKIYPLPEVNQGVEVYCDLESDDGGWTVIQRRDHQMPRENFFRTWSDYEKGFGSPYNHFWLGLSSLAELTGTGDQQLRVELTDWEGNFRTANYGFFRVANRTDQYRLHVADYSGNAGDSMAHHNGMQFTTKDKDNDLERSINCAQNYIGGWWYRSCHQANLNGLYVDKGKHGSYGTGINWYLWHGYYYSLKKTEMKIRNRHFAK
ncbi:unnamed protein product [Allacma fusca]|uniref:Fibrinogen C-terminal domain-containing protein n=1 Tax=Allacma fusca TaxID=39272 RepID=A0A8J2L9L3_9HEXA|nr:unnamed protein product [Allacma fusca]